MFRALSSDKMKDAIYGKKLESQKEEPKKSSEEEREKMSIEDLIQKLDTDQVTILDPTFFSRFID